MSTEPPSEETGAFKVEIRSARRAAQSPEAIGLAAANLLDVLALFEPFGVWRLDIENGLTYWSEDMYRLHGLEPKPGPVDMIQVIRCYHPDDREHVIGCIEDAITRQSGFRFVLRIGTADEVTGIVEALGRYRVNPEGRAELFGTCRAVGQRVRSVAINP
ncbi:PAS domain-containing protein [Zhengella sp. ZM62]|uniref:PAS domain-containing protein n=1 Tax=Zhengella sedimenti TaxID=3390035 RepID=UPI003974CF43